jgi:hypothetical protein
MKPTLPLSKIKEVIEEVLSPKATFRILDSRDRIELKQRLLNAFEEAAR